MPDSGFYLLPRNKLYKKEKTNRLKNFPAGYMGSFYRNVADNVDNFLGSDFYSRIATDSDIPTEDVQNTLSLKSFIYSLIEILCFPNPLVKKMYKKYQIDRILCYHFLTDTDSTFLQFVIVSYPASNFPECDVRDTIFEVIVKTEIFKRLDTSHSFWKKIDAQKPKRQKKLGLYEVENIDDLCYVTLAVNPKEYFEFFKDYSTNSKHKGIKKGSKGMDFENYPERIKCLKNFDIFEHPKNEYKQVTRFMIKKGEMVTTSVVEKNKR